MEGDTAEGSISHITVGGKNVPEDNYDSAAALTVTSVVEVQDLGDPLRAVGIAAIAGISIMLVLAPQQTIVIVVRMAEAG